MPGPRLPAAEVGEAPAPGAPRALAPDERRARLVAWLAAAAGRALQLPAGRIDPAQPLTAAGLDSLAAVELGQAVESALGFELPLADLLAGLSLQELAERLAAELPAAAPRLAMDPAADSPAGPAAADPEELPLSCGQRALWFLDRLAPGNPAYVVAGSLRVAGELDAAAFRRAFEALIDRHPALRATFGDRAGEPFQRIAPRPAEGWFRAEDLSGLEPADRDAPLAAAAYAPFDLVRGPLVRIGIFRAAPAEHRVTIALHHLVADLWSAGVLAADLGTLLAGGAPPPPAGTFAEHVRRERLLVEGPAGERAWAFWRDRLAGAPAALELAGDRPRPPVQTFRGAARTLRLAPGLEARAAALAAAQRATPFVVLFAAWCAVLGRWSGQDDLLVGTPTAGRGSAASAGIVGYFVNPVVLRVDLARAATFGGLVAETRSAALAAFAHPELPFALLAERLVPERDPSRSPLFQVLFALQQAPRRAEQRPSGGSTAGEALAALALGVPGVPLELGGLRAETAALERPGAQLDLSLFAARLGGELAACLEFNTEIWDAATAGRLLGCFEAALAAGTAAPATAFADLPLLSPPERAQLLREWNDTDPGAATDLCLHELFEAQVVRNPGRTALVCGAATVSYGELEEWSNRLARRLRQLGVGPEVRVGVALARTPALVAALLAVLKAGGAYVPLDPAYPAERTGFMLADSGTRVLLTGGTAAAAIPAAGARCAVVDPQDPALSRLDAAPLPRRALPDNLAYVIYTSGSTGRPKGVAIRHGSAAARVRWACAAFAAEELAAVLAATSVCFDLSVFEIFAPLAAGGRAILAGNVLELPELAAAGEVTLVNTVPSALAELLRTGGLPSAVRTVNLAGEPLLRSLVEEVAAAAPGVRRVLNLYGPSEDTTYSTGAAVEAGAEPAIGRPLPGTRVHLVDRSLRLVPAGAPGELCLGGTGLARGYLGRPELTAAAFVPDPFAAEPGGARLYRTGDLARRRWNGELEFLGRRDQQVKVRGFRIELGEVEAALAAHPGVAECAVVVAGAGSARRLAAYWAARDPLGGTAPEERELRAFLARRLPASMVPSLFTILPALPKTPSGKIDRKALPGPAPARGGDVAAPEARSPIAEIVAAVWAAVLEVERVGEESFFDLGGHSLLATRVVARLREALGVELPLARFFAAPTVQGVAAEVARLQATGALPDALPLRPEARGELAPASFAQERMWFLARFEDEAPVYHLPAAVRLAGVPAVPALAVALAEVARRHEALRTTFETGPDGELLQRVGPPPAPRLPVVDLSALPAAQREAACDGLAAAEARRPFDLAAGPHLRAMLLRAGYDDHVLLLTLHHIVADGWSLGVLARELEALYGAFGRGLPAPLPALPLQYADFALWQRRELAGERLAAALRFWEAELAGLPALDLPADRPRPARLSFAGAVRRRVLPQGLAAGLAALCRGEAATLFMALLAGLVALLVRRTGQEDVAVGTPVANRTRGEVEGLIGLFVNTLVLRTDAARDPAFAELLARVRRSCLSAFGHQDLPFEKLVEALRPERDPARTPLFQTLLSLQTERGDGLRLPGLAAQAVAVATGTAKFDLTLAVAADPAGGLAVEAEFRRALFEPASLDRLLTQLEAVLAAAVADRSCRLWDLPLLAAAERAQLLREWNDTGDAGAAGADRCLHELFEAQAARTPGQAAVVWGEAATTYGELDRWAGRLARRLRALGVGPEVRVGVALERTPALVAALLAVLKAGGAYVPLDPAYPAERLAFMAADSGARVLLAAAGAAAGWAPSDLPVVEVAALPDGDAEPLAPIAPLAVPDNLAYLIYTSGSTGHPKGVAIRHANAAALVRWACGAFSPAELSGVLAATSVCFDLSVFEIFVPLAAGGRVILAADVLQLAEIPAAGQVTLVNTVPSALGELLRGAGLPRSVRTVNLAGEPLLRSLVEEVAAAAPWVRRVVNFYGPSEDTTYSTWSDVGADTDPSGAGEPAIGRPLAGTRVYLVDRGRDPVPVGTAGELLLGGEGLARGYLGRPDLTAAAFVPDPFAERPGERLYHTGDLARRRPDGALEFLGRRDQQVKVRGFRIELGEIEAALSALPAVAECAVAARGEGAGRRLVAYWAPRAERVEQAEGPAAWQALRDGLAARLPAALVPSLFVALPALPKTPSGKIDRKALPELAVEARAETAGAAPRSPVEEVLAGIWAAVLGLDRVGREESFFDLGGHSLLATRVAARVRDALGVELPVRALFEAPTVAALAARLAAGGPAAPEDSDPIVPVPRTGPQALSTAQERLWFLAQLDAASPAYNIPVALRLRGGLDAAALATALTAVAARHEALRTTFGEADGRPFQAAAPVAGLALPLLDLAGLGPASDREAEALRQARAEAVRPFDLARGPLLRAAFWRLAPDDHLLLFNLHHIVADGWSIGVLTREVERFYAAAVGAPSPPLPPLPVQYADYAAWQRRRLAGAAAAARLVRCKDRLAGAPTALELPADRQRPAARTAAGAVVGLRLDPALAGALRNLGRRSDSSLFMTLLAGFAALLARHTGQDDLLVGTPAANRDRVEAEGLIGLFANTLVLRCNLAGDPAMKVTELLARARAAALDGYAHQDVPFEQLVAELARDRDLGRNPLVQVLLSLAPSERRVRLPGLAADLLDLDTGTAKLDLTLTVLGEEDGALALSLEYSSELFDRASARRWLERFRALLGGLTAAPACRLSDLPLLPAAERAQLLREWNDTARSVPAATLHGLIAAQAARTPHARALLFEGEALTYAGLLARARRLALELRSRGVRRGTLVGICLERSPDLVAAVLAVLEAGGAYVPLDPAYPRERLAMMLEDSRAPLLVTAGPLAAALPEHRADLLLLDEPLPDEVEPGAGPLDENAGPLDLAYVLFTSGSTGRPKGVQISHGAIVNFLLSMRERPALAAGDRLLAVTSLSFDIAGLELFLPLSVGAEVEIASRAVAADGLQLLARVTAGGATALQATPATWKLLLEAGWQGGEDLLVLCGGEAMPRALAAELTARSARVWNLYGPTETTVWSAVHRLAPGAAGPVPLGRPIANTTIHLLDRDLRAVPVGVTGELYIGGAGLSRGYLGRPDLTAERFVPDPFGAGRLYRTGDLARALPDGTLDFLGRRDHQVKVRGFRIEIEEIEAVLGRCPAVAACAVALRPRPAGEAQLVAYAVPRAGAAPDLGELRRFLRERLPEVMVPAVFVTLPTLPLTPNGKVDRKALPAPGAPRPVSSAAPRTEVERRIAEVWREVLGVEPGLHDNFFDLGGHSLLLLRAHRRLQTVFETEIALTELFRHPTVAALAEVLARGGRSERSLAPAFARAARIREVRARRPDVARRGPR